MTARILSIVAAAFLLLSCTAAVRYSGNYERPEKPEEEADHQTTEVAVVEKLPTSEDERDNPQIRHQQDGPGDIDRARMNRIVANYLGVPYQLGGTGKLGIDCSGLLYVLYRDYDGTRLPLSTEALYRLDDRIEFDDLTFGDLVFFRLGGRKVSHVGMYLENMRFVHASESRGVTVDELTSEYFATAYAGARRVK